MSHLENKIILPGGAGLVGQNLIVHLKINGYKNITVIDKHKKNLNIIKKLHKDVKVIEADLSLKGSWQEEFIDAESVIMLQAQIGGLYYKEFVSNNIHSTENILNTMLKHNNPYLVHVSSSVIESVANDFYTESKKAQELLVKKSKIDHVILRPTLMFGWFDRKHLGWLSHFMKLVPIFPIPGHGNYIRQPLYAGDFSKIIMSCIKNRITDKTYNISGLERINYIDMIRIIKKSIRSKVLIIKIPYKIFYFLLWLWSVFDKNPPFTTQQLEALVAKDEFEVINWPKIFSISSTPFSDAINETFNHKDYSSIRLDF